MAQESSSAGRDGVPDVGDRRRYARQVALEGFGEQGQAALAGAHVLVVGAGGLGSPVISHLAAGGVGRLTVVDDDVVELSNLPRQLVHTESFLGQAKVDSVIDAVGRQNSTVTVRGVREPMSVELALDLVPGCDVVVDCTDSVDARYVLNDACVLLGVPFVWASIDRFAGQFGVVDAGRAACYRCVFPEPARAAGGVTCEVGGVLGVLPGVMGAMQAGEVIKVLTGVGEPALGALRFYDAIRATMTTIPVARDPECSACGRGVLFAGLDHAAAVEVDGVTGADGAGPGGALGSVVLDVREDDEVTEMPLPTVFAETGAELRQVAWGGGWSDDALADVAEWAGGRRVVVVCAAGVRSRAAGAALRARGVDAVSLRGGVNALRGAQQARPTEVEPQGGATRPGEGMA